MPVKEQDQALVEQIFKAMHAREKGESIMSGLFAENATLIEPFSGEPRTHQGHASIMSWFREAVTQMPPDMTIKMDRIDMDSGRVRADWTCTSSAFSTPMKGIDFYRIQNGKIEHAEFVVTEMPPMG